MVTTMRPKSHVIVKDIPVAHINLDGIDWKQKAVAAEPTGKGDLLCIDGWFGRMFRSCRECVEDELDEYVRMYNEMCARLDEDPAHEYYEVLSWNDLYYLHGLMPSIAGDEWGYTNTDDYRVDMDFRIEYIDHGEYYELFGEPYIVYYPYDWCTPDACYKEV